MVSDFTRYGLRVSAQLAIHQVGTRTCVQGTVGKSFVKWIIAKMLIEVLRYDEGNSCNTSRTWYLHWMRQSIIHWTLRSRNQLTTVFISYLNNSLTSLLFLELWHLRSEVALSNSSQINEFNELTLIFYTFLSTIFYLRLRQTGFIIRSYFPSSCCWSNLFMAMRILSNNSIHIPRHYMSWIIFFRQSVRLFSVLTESLSRLYFTEEHTSVVVKERK